MSLVRAWARDMRDRLLGRPRYVVRAVILPAQAYIRTEAGGGIVLLVAAIAAVLWANSPWSDSYFELLDRELAIDFSWFTIEEHLHEWVNDGLMVIFFFVVGLEIKREVLRGELATFDRALVPAAAALGGMVVPALIFAAFNAGGEGAGGWGIPMATDIAFAVGVLALLGNRIPFGLKVFLLALAIVDDLGAIAVIAIFYTDQIEIGWLIGAFVAVGAVLALQRAGVRSVYPYIAVGIVLWIALLESGIHATIAGVTLGLLTPAFPYYRPAEYANIANGLVARYEAARLAGEEDAAGALLREIEEVSRDSESPLDRLEHAIHPWSSYLVIPIFALANAGLQISGDSIRDAAESSVTHGVIVGLVAGKVIGVLGASWLAVRFGGGSLPGGAGWRQIAGVSMLAGVGFTVSLFITGLAYTDQTLIDDARLGIFVASILAGAGGYVWLRSTSRRAGAST